MERLLLFFIMIHFNIIFYIFDSRAFVFGSGTSLEAKAWANAMYRAQIELEWKNALILIEFSNFASYLTVLQI